MFKLLQGGLSAVAGTAEPEYGKEAIHPFFETLTPEDKLFRSTEIKDFNWLSPKYTNVETQTFYFTDLNLGISGFAQVIHSNVMGVHTTAQFTFRLYNYKGNHDENIWTSTKLENFRIEGSNFYANDLSIELSEDNTTYELKSNVNKASVVNLKIQRIVPGVIFGKDGTTLYGDDVTNPWGSMRHVFWPRCKVTGTIGTESSLGSEEVFNIDGYTMLVMALQGMKPHHAAKSWNFLNFHSSKYSALQMEFTTPKSYANTKVNVGIVSDDKGLILASINNKIIHLDSQIDEIGWPVPKRIIFNYTEGGEALEPAEGISADSTIETTIPTVVDKNTIVVKGDFENLVERVDVMAEIPQFVKNIVSGVAGTKPYIYQYCNEFEIEDTQNKIKDKGIAFCEVTFILEFS